MSESVLLLAIRINVNHLSDLPVVYLQGYGDVFIRKIKQKHTLARNYFSRLPGMAELIRKQKMDNAQSMAPGPSSLTGHAMTSQPQKV